MDTLIRKESGLLPSITLVLALVLLYRSMLINKSVSLSTSTYFAVICTVNVELIHFRNRNDFKRESFEIILKTFRNRQIGKTALWNPGCDHAGIATQVF